MWIVSAWDVYRGMTMDRLTKFLKDTKKFLKDTKPVTDLLGEADKVSARPSRTGELVKNVATIIFPLDMLVEPSDSPGVLRGSLTMNGVAFVVEAIEVTSEGSVQDGVTLEAQSYLEDMPYTHGPFETVKHKGREYVLRTYPYSR